MLSRFHLIPERYGRTDRQTDRFASFAISISRVSVLTRDKNQTTVLRKALRTFKVRWLYVQVMRIIILFQKSSELIQVLLTDFNLTTRCSINRRTTQCQLIYLDYQNTGCSFTSNFQIEISRIYNFWT